MNSITLTLFLSSVFFLQLSVSASELQTKVLINDDYPDSYDSAHTIELNTVYNGAIDTKNDIDWFKITLTGGDFWSDSPHTYKYIASIKNHSAVKIQMYSGEPYALQINTTNCAVRTPSRPESGCTSDPYPNCISNLMYLEPGDYYIKISYYQNAEEYEYNIELQTWTPNCETINYCKDYPEQCGMKQKIIIVPL